MMTETMYIGSGDVAALMSGKDTKGHAALMQRFVSGVKPYYNALASPIDALRTGAILEDRYYLTLPDGYFPQYTVVSREMDVFKCSLDFARLEKGRVADFDELKTLSFFDYIDNIEPIREDGEQLLRYVKKKHKNYYNQVQEQLYCTELEGCNIVFLCVETYEDGANMRREIHPHDYTKIRITRDEAAIAAIKERGSIFQQIKDYYTKKN